MIKRLLIIVDMQEGFRFKNVEELIPNIKKLIENFKGDKIFTCFSNYENSNFVKRLKWNKFIEKKDKEILSELREYKLKKIRHNSYTLFGFLDISNVFEKEYDEIYLVGIYTDVCISKTVMDLFDEKFVVKIISDCVTSQNKEDNQVFLNSLSRVIGKENIIQLKDILNNKL